MKKKIIIGVLFIVVVVLTIIILDSTTDINFNIVNKKNTSNVIRNTNENVIKDAKLKELDLTDISLSYVKGTGSTFSVKLTNNTDKAINIESFNITFKDSEGNVIAVLAAYVGGNVYPKQVNTIKVTAKENISEAVSVEYSVD